MRGASAAKASGTAQGRFSIFGGGLCDGPVGLLGDRPRRAVAAGAGLLEVAGVAPFQGSLARGAFQRQGGRTPGALRNPAGRAAELVSVTTRMVAGSTMQVTSRQMAAHHRTDGS